MTERAGRARWPRWVYGGGTEPDARFSFANERTFLAWIRTALALLAAGLAVDTVALPIADGLQRLLALITIGLGLLCTLASWTRWARAERAMRLGEPLPAASSTLVLAAGVLVVGLIVLVAA